MQKDYNIILVENEPDIIKLTKKTLEIGGFNNVYVVETAEHFYDKIRNTDKIPDLIILDILLQDKNGIEILKFIKNNINYKKTKVIVFTAIAEKEKIKEFFNAGADDMIIKPFDPYDFIEKINIILRVN